jgi:myosin heavy subunit
MQICRRRYDRARNGTIQYQALYRGYATRKELAAIKVQTHVRKQKQLRIFLKLKSATIALQCALRARVARQLLFELKKEQKDVGKLKQNNEKLKSEMASLRAMLAAQAKGDASRAANEKEMEDKQREIDKLEKRVAQLEEELEQKKALIAQIEAKMKAQKEQSAAELNKLHHQVHHLNTNKSHRRSPTPPSPGGHNRLTPSPSINVRKTADGDAGLASVSEDMVSPEVLEQHRAQLMRLEDELEAERKHRRAADGEIIKLRAAMGGVQLSDSDVNALLPKAMESLPPAETETIEEEVEEERLDERYVISDRLKSCCACIAVHRL